MHFNFTLGDLRKPIEIYEEMLRSMAGKIETAGVKSCSKESIVILASLFFKKKATLSNCGYALKLQLPSIDGNITMWLEVMTLGYGNNVED